MPEHSEDVVHVRSPTFASLELVQEVKQWHGVLNEHGRSSVSGRLQDGGHGCAVSRVQFDQSLGQQQSNDVGPVTSIYRYARMTSGDNLKGDEIKSKHKGNDRKAF